EACSSKHLAFQYFGAINMPFDRAATPGEGHAGFDRRIVFREPGREALQGFQGTGGRPLQPGIELRRLPLTDPGGKGLRQGDYSIFTGFWYGSRRAFVVECWPQHASTEDTAMFGRVSEPC